MLSVGRLAPYSVTSRSDRADYTGPLTPKTSLIISSLSHHQDASDVVAGLRVGQNCLRSATLTRLG